MMRVLYLFCFILTQLPSLAAQQSPNVILILTDDQGSVDLNCYGAKDLVTPNIDRLAAEGVKFTQFYVASPVCSPSRASLLTGLNPHAAGLSGNTSSQPGHEGMPTEQFTIAEMLKEAGYKTSHIGKWHLGYSKNTIPTAQGFDESFGHMGGCIDNYSHFFYWNGPNRHDLWQNGKEVWRPGEYFPDLMVEQAKDFINRNNEEPFFMYFALNNPHYPLQPEPKWQSHYKDLPQPRRDYAAFVSTMDERIGELIKHLEETGLRENTIIIFQSDHGHSVEERAFGGGGSAGPYRGAKFSLFEGGIRVPAIISWPGQIPRGESRDQMAFNIDWMSTIASLCGLRLPAIQGKDLSNVIKDAEAKSPHELFRWKSGVSWAIRKGDWKLIGLPRDPVNPNSLDPEKDRLFLSNIQQDASEDENLAFLNPGKVEELLADYLKWPHASPEDVPQERQRIKNKAFGKSVTLSHPPHPNYSQGGSTALIDERSGSRLFSDGYWLGFESEDLEAVIDLGSVMPTISVSIGVLEDPSTWIFFPDFIEISFSLDGKSYTQPVRLGDVGRKESRKVSMKRMQLDSENMDIRFIKVFAKNIGECPAWHQAAGSKAWLFVDEITVE